MINTASRRPIARAQVTTSNAGTATNATGHWILPNLPCAATRFMAEHPGFLPATTAPVPVAGDIQIALTPESALTGKVRDGAADPIPEAELQLYESIVKDGKRSSRLVAAVNTNTAGDYRIDQLKLARYKLCASSSKPVWTADPGEPLHYPEACYELQTTGIELRQDFTLTAAQAFHVRGAVSGLPESARTLIRIGRADARTSTAGRFDIPGILPGPHLIEGFAAIGERTAFASAPIEVGTANLDDVMLRFAPAVTLTGTLRSESPLPENVSLRVSLISSQTEFTTTAEWDSDERNFVFSKIASGSYRLSTGALPAPWYLKSARVNGEEIANGEFPVGSPSTIELTLGDDPAVITGTASPGAEIVALGATQRAVASTAKGDGTFRIANLPPGDYDVYTFDASVEAEYTDPGWMQANAPAPTKVSAAPNATINLILK